jgi:hypothetical protein
LIKYKGMQKYFSTLTHPQGAMLGVLVASRCIFVLRTTLLGHRNTATTKKLDYTKIYLTSVGTTTAGPLGEPAIFLRTHSAPTLGKSPLFGACARVPAMCLRYYSTPALGCLRCACGSIRRLRSGAWDAPADPFGAHARELYFFRRLRSSVCDMPADTYCACAQNPATFLRTH